MFRAEIVTFSFRPIMMGLGMCFDIRFLTVLLSSPQ